MRTTSELNLMASSELKQSPQRESSRVKQVSRCFTLPVGQVLRHFLEVSSLVIGSGAKMTVKEGPE